MTIEERIRDRKVGILGMARSGLAAAELVLDRGGMPFVSDSAPADRVSEPIAKLQHLGISFETDGHSDRLLACDYLVVSPGVPLNIKILQRAREAGLPIFSELEIASWVCPGRIVAITGSNGKTTTTTLMGEILTAAGFDTHVCGNIGRPLSEVVGRMTADSIAVVEVSSFQLETVSLFKPCIAMILNLTPDHIDRHGSFETYKKTKYRITENQTEADLFLLNHNDVESMTDDPPTQARKAYFSAATDDVSIAFESDGYLSTRDDRGVQQVIRCDEIAIKGPHNLQNASAAVAVATQLGVSIEVMRRVLTGFPGVEHRLEDAGVVAGVAFVNDSKATNIDSVKWALRSISTPLYLILGGRDKGGQFGELIEIGRGKVKEIIVIGEAKDKITTALQESFSVKVANTLQDAVSVCFGQAHPGETVLLSPGCASFDMFDNYEHRGRVFKEAVQSLRNGKSRDEAVSH
ncbi:MAG: UDP-N-acetylmuramoyl-L-alanine--D-glutamate ligase [candidate division Zixibacteria bacterium]|nr:UDP-N-acetylmuramoyl-L-alanine--D-glutamate ligase [candidate division Zixibacteria bacterium]